MAWFWYALLSAVTSAALILFNKFGMAPKIDVVLLSCLQVLIMAMLLVSISMTLGKFNKQALLSCNLGNWIFLFVTGGLAASSWIFYLAALKTGMVSQVETLVRFSFVIAVIASVLLFDKPLTIYMVIGISLVTLGLYLVSFN